MTRLRARDAHARNVGALLAAFSALGIAHAAPPERPLRAGPAQSATLAAGEHARYRVHVGAGQSLDVVLQQLDATLQIRLEAAHDDGLPLYQNDAGRQARVRLTLVAEAAEDVVLDVGVKSDIAAHYTIAATQPHAADARDRQRRSAQHALATAENLRREAGSLEAGKGADAAEIATRALGAYAAAIEAANSAGDACTASMARSGRARWYFAHGDYAASRRDAEAALPTHCGADGDLAAAAEAAVAERTLASSLGYQGDVVASVEIAERALARYRQTGDPNYQAMLLGNLSANYRVLGETHRALETAQAALDKAQAIGDRKRALFSRESMASIHLQSGELAPALALYREVIAELRTTPYPLIDGMSWNDLGLLYGRLGDSRAAEDAYAHAIAAWTATGDQSGLAETELNAADAMLENGRLDAAEAAYRRALAFDIEHRFQREQIHALAGLGRAATARRDWPQAEDKLAASAALAHELHAEILEAGAHLALGDLASRRDEARAARTEYAQAATLAEHGGDRATRVAARASLARLDAAAGRLDLAQRGIEDAIATIEAERAAIADPALRTSYFATQRAYYSLYIDVLMRRHARAPNGGFAARALLAAERARARSLLELLASKRIDVQPRVDDALLIAQRGFEDHRRELAWRLAQLAPNSDPASRAALQHEIDQTEREIDVARGKIDGADPRYAALMEPAPLELADIRRELLDADTVALEYWLDEQRSYVWRVGTNALDVAELPGRAVIDARVSALRERVRAGSKVAAATSIEALAAHDAQERAEIAKLARVLENTLVPRAMREAEKRRIVVADGSVQLVPFALVSGDASAVYVPSLAALRSLRKNSSPPSGASAYAVLADPVFRADDPRLEHRDAVAAADSLDDALVFRDATTLDLKELPRLPQTRREAATIAALSGGDPAWVALDFAATRRAVLDADWSKFAGVHFATHALLDLRNPELSGIVMSLVDASGTAQDGFLRISDLYNLRMPLDLVVLSVCDSAEGQSPGAEGVFSLARAFFNAGARRVVASLWPVDDRASAVFMAHFYAALLGEHRSAEASLLAAQAAMRADARWRAPVHWAGYVLQGDWSSVAAR